jgi:hypothetical protein
MILPLLAAISDCLDGDASQLILIDAELMELVNEEIVLSCDKRT